MPINKTDAFYQTFIDQQNEKKKDLTRKIDTLSTRLRVETEKSKQLNKTDTTEDESALSGWEIGKDKSFNEHQKKILVQEDMLAAMVSNYDRETVRIQREIDALTLKLSELKGVHETKLANIRRQLNGTRDHMEKSLSFFDKRIQGAKERIDQAIGSKNPVIIKMGLELKELEEQLAKVDRILAGA
jgi:hypothetical protein